MNIYFTASVSQQSLYGQNYEKIISLLQKMGHKVFHDHVTKPTKSELSESEDADNERYKDVIRKISEADLIVAEVSFPSTINIGHRVTLALEKGKPVIALYVHGKQSRSFSGMKHDKFVYEEYSFDTLDEVLKESLEFAIESSDTRFNFLISPSLLSYLDWISKNRRIPRSVYLRRLIETDREKNKDFSHEK